MGKRDFQYDGCKPDGHTTLRFATWNVGTMVGRGMEIVMELMKRRVSVCCIQEVRWKGDGVRFMGV